VELETVIVPVLLQALVEELDWSPRFNVELVTVIVDELVQTPLRDTTALSAVMDEEFVQAPPKLRVVPLGADRARSFTQFVPDTDKLLPLSLRLAAFRLPVSPLMFSASP
jgi:hypothetical protein